MEIIAHSIQLSFHWFLRISGVLPVSYKMKEKYFKPHTCTWAISKIGINLCFIHILIIFINIISALRSYEGKFQLVFNTETFILMTRNLLELAILCMAMLNIVIMVTRRKKMEKLLNDINKLYIRVLIKTDKSRLKGNWICASPIVTYLIFTLIIKATSLYIYRQISAFMSFMDILKFFILYWYEMTTYCAEPLASLIFASLEIIIDGIRFGMETDLPSVSQYDWECWTNKKKYMKIDKVNVKIHINEYREMYQDLSRIIHIANSMFGLQLFVTFTYNQFTCVIYAFYVTSLTTSEKELDENTFIQTIFFLIYSIVVITRNIYLCHRGEQVTAKAKQMFLDAALIDSSRINEESKFQLIHFLRDSSEANFRISVINVFFLDYRQMFLVLSVTSTYILIILQYMGPRG